MADFKGFGCRAVWCWVESKWNCRFAPWFRPDVFLVGSKAYGRTAQWSPAPHALAHLGIVQQHGTPRLAPAQRGSLQTPAHHHGWTRLRGRTSEVPRAEEAEKTAPRQGEAAAGEGEALNYEKGSLQWNGQLTYQEDEQGFCHQSEGLSEPGNVGHPSRWQCRLCTHRPRAIFKDLPAYAGAVTFGLKHLKSAPCSRSSHSHFVWRLLTMLTTAQQRSRLWKLMVVLLITHYYKQLSFDLCQASQWCPARRCNCALPKRIAPLPRLLKHSG